MSSRALRLSTVSDAALSTGSVEGQYTFEPRRGQPDWARVLALDLKAFSSTRAAAAENLEQLLDVGYPLRTAVLEPDPRLAPEANLARFVQAANVLALDAEFESSAAEADLRDAYYKLDLLRAQLASSQARRCPV